jgi:tetratricopeptide (TPR) repeat protein
VVQQMTSEEALAQHPAFLVGADAARAQGDLTGALARYRAAGEVVAAIAGDGAARHVLDGLAMAQQRIGEVLVAQGDLAAALEAMRAELAVRRRIAEAQPGDAARRDDVARAAARVAEVLVLRSALATFQGGGQAAGQVGGLTRRRPGEASWTMSAVAGALEAQGNLGGALALYREGLAIRRRLVAQDPDNVAWALDVTWSLTGLGGALMARGDLDGALASLGEALAIRRGLAARDPDNGQRRLDVSWSLMAVGDALADKGDHAGSLAALREALAVRRVLLAADPENDGLRCDASVSLTRIGDVQAASGDLDGAAAAFHEARAIVEQLITRAPERAEWREDLIAIDECIAELARAA